MMEDNNNLSESELAFYDKHIRLKELGIDAQIKLKKASVLVVGAGGLGCPALLYLAASGIGKIGIVDFDEISLSNLHRQTLYTHEMIGKYKADEAAKQISIINPYIDVKAYNKKINLENAEDITKEYDIILDSPDNYETRYILHDICHKYKKIIVHASVFRFQGQLAVFTPNSPCYRCTFPEEPNVPRASVNSENGIFGALACIIGTMQATETIKIITNMSSFLENTLLCFNLLDYSIKRFKLTKDSDCPLCSSKNIKVNDNEYKTI